MKRFVAPFALLLALLVVPETAWARGDGWQFLPSSSSSTQACGTTVALDVLANTGPAAADHVGGGTVPWREMVARRAAALESTR